MPGIVLAAIAAALDLAAAVLGWDDVRPFTKPLPALILGISAARSGRWPTRILAIGFLFAMVGDALLLRNTFDAFLGGMLAFAAMHLAYIIAYHITGTAAPRDKATWGVAGVYLLALVGANVLLDPHAGTLAVPLAVYSVLLAAMAWSAFDLHNRMRAGAILVALGGAIFMLSDTTLAFARFYPGFALSDRAAELVIVGTYFFAQLLIATGMWRATRTIAS
jgi:uncharacterized membrane protein YhhN